jgi:L-asparaginase
MQASSGTQADHVVILATGGTIAGTASHATEALDYRAAQLSIGELLDGVPGMAERSIDSEQLARIDSKDMSHAIWGALVGRVAWHLARTDVAGIVVTHGTDTLEETAYLLQRLLAPGKPVVLTAAMRPATSLQADGPQNLLDAVALATEPGACGVLVVLAGRVHGALDVRKTHTYRLDAFGSGDAGPLAMIEAGRLRRFREWPRCHALGAELVRTEHWPRVEIVTSHAGADGLLVDALVAQGVAGIVAAGTGNGSLHHALEAALHRAVVQGVAVRRTTRVPDGEVRLTAADALPVSAAASPQQARIDLMLELLGRR